ncbi:MAG: hypothetical protein ABL993_04335 [Vicinamibacterales bacterium]
MIAFFGFAAISLVPSLLTGNGPWALGLGIILLFFVLPYIGKSLLGTALGGGLGGLLLVGGLLFFFLGNARSCDTGSAPRGSVGTPLDLNRIGYLAESEYDTCLAGYINAEAAQNSQLRTAAQQCQVAADASVSSCLTRVQDQWWNLDKAGTCRDEASATAWRPCAIRALQGRAADSGNVAIGMCEGRTVTTGLMRRVAGLFSKQSPSTGATQSSPPPSAYDTNCLGNAFNSNLGSMPDLQCNQYTSRVIDGRGQRIVIDDLPRFQDCMIQSLVKGMGDRGTQLVNACRAPTP